LTYVDKFLSNNPDISPKLNIKKEILWDF
jgi:hypothetical protein